MSEDRYKAWIEQYLVEQKGVVLGRCADACTKMHVAFPELVIKKGHVYDLSWGKRAHWWLVSPDGRIVDPTASQFPVVIEYEEWKPGDEVRVGKCMNCGEEIWREVKSIDSPPAHETFCSPECHDTMAADLMDFG